MKERERREEGLGRREEGGFEFETGVRVAVV